MVFYCKITHHNNCNYRPFNCYTLLARIFPVLLSNGYHSILANNLAFKLLNEKLIQPLNKNIDYIILFSDTR